MNGLAGLISRETFSSILDQLELLYKGVISPPLRVAGLIPYEFILTLVPHFFPALFQYSATKISHDEEDADNGLSEEVTHDLITRIEEIKQRVYPHARAPDISIYTKQENKAISYGGFLSVQDPTLTIPERNGLIESLKVDREEEVEVLSAEDQEIVFNKDETEFLITRELFRVKLQAGLIRIVALAILFGLAIGLAHVSIPTLIASVISWGVYIIVFSSGQHQIEYQIDRKAFRILQDMYRDEGIPDTHRAEGIADPAQAAYRTMYNTYRKIQANNLRTRELHWWNKLYIMPDGDDLWDMFSRPAVTWQIERYAGRAGIRPPAPLVLQEV